MFKQNVAFLGQEMQIVKIYFNLYCHYDVTNPFFDTHLGLEINHASSMILHSVVSEKLKQTHGRAELHFVV